MNSKRHRSSSTSDYENQTKLNKDDRSSDLSKRRLIEKSLKEDGHFSERKFKESRSPDRISKDHLSRTPDRISKDHLSRTPYRIPRISDRSCSPDMVSKNRRTPDRITKIHYRSRTPERISRDRNLERKSKYYRSPDRIYRNYQCSPERIFKDRYRSPERSYRNYSPERSYRNYYRSNERAYDYPRFYDRSSRHHYNLEMTRSKEYYRSSHHSDKEDRFHIDKNEERSSNEDSDGSDRNSNKHAGKDHTSSDQSDKVDSSCEKRDKDIQDHRPLEENQKKEDNLLEKSSKEDYQSNCKIESTEIQPFKNLIDDKDLYRGLQECIQLEYPSQVQMDILSAIKANKNKNLYIKSNLFTNIELIALIWAYELIQTDIDKIQVIFSIPTTELVTQMTRLAKNLFKYTKVRVKSTTGKDNHLNDINEHILIATAGSMISCLFKFNSVQFEHLKLITFDLIDLLSNSNTNQHTLHKTISHVKPDCQLLFFDSSPCEYSFRFINDCVANKLITFNLLDNTRLSKCVKHYNLHVDSKINRFRAFMSILNNSKFKKIVVFTLGKNTSSFIFKNLIKYGFRDTIILSNELSFNRRLDAIKDYNSRKVAILLTNYPLTINIKLTDTSLIVNYDLIKDGVAEYLHKASHLFNSNLNDPDRLGYIINFICLDDRRLKDETKVIEKELDIRISEIDVRKKYDFTK